MTNADETKRIKAKNLRYRKAISKNMNLDAIRETLWDIQEECDNVRYYFESDDDTLLNALDGDEEQEYEFKMMFSDLCAECEQMAQDLEDAYIPECFDIFFGAIDEGTLIGWDSYEGDYFGLNDGFKERWAREENTKRLERMTKKELLEAAHMCFKVATAYLGLTHRYDCLKAAMDILKDENTGYLQMVKEIEEKYEAAEKDGFYRGHKSGMEFNQLLDAMPQIAWLQ